MRWRSPGSCRRMSARWCSRTPSRCARSATRAQPAVQVPRIDLKPTIAHLATQLIAVAWAVAQQQQQPCCQQLLVRTKHLGCRRRRRGDHGAHASRPDTSSNPRIHQSAWLRLGCPNSWLGHPNTSARPLPSRGPAELDSPRRRAACLCRLSFGCGTRPTAVTRPPPGARSRPDEAPLRLNGIYLAAEQDCGSSVSRSP